jgi:hypothetical protein
MDNFFLNNWINSLFGPFEKEIYCIYFLILEILYFLLFFIILFIFLYLGINNNEGLKFYFDKSLILLQILAMYFVCRLLYSMCVHSI